MVCKVARSKLFQYMDGELPEEQASALESHLAACPDCWRLVELERSFRERYIEPLRPAPTPQRVRDQITKLLDALPDRAPARRFSASLRWGFLAGLAVFNLVYWPMGFVTGDAYQLSPKSIHVQMTRVSQ